MVVMTTMTVTPMNDDADDGEDDGGGGGSGGTEGTEGGGVGISVAIAPGPEHKSLESTRPHSLDMLQQDILILKQHENLVVIRHGDPFRKTGRIP